MPHASQFSQVFTWKKLGEMVPVREHRQCLLFFCNLSVGRLRVLRYIGSLHKTHTGVTAHFGIAVRLSGYGAWHKQKNCHELYRTELSVKAP